MNNLGSILSGLAKCSNHLLCLGSFLFLPFFIILGVNGGWNGRLRSSEAVVGPNIAIPTTRVEEDGDVRVIQEKTGEKKKKKKKRVKKSETSFAMLMRRYKRATTFSGPKEKRLAWRLLFGKKRFAAAAVSRTSSVGEINGARLLMEAGKSVGVSRVRTSTKNSYDSGLPWMWPGFIRFVTTRDSSTSISATVDEPREWGLHGMSSSNLVDVLVQFQSYLVMEGLTHSQAKNQWLKTYDRFSTPGPDINSSVISDSVWKHQWVRDSRSVPRVSVDLLRGEARRGVDSSERQQLAAGFAILWQVRQRHIQNDNWNSQDARFYALCYIAIALMFNFGWRPGQVVWTGNASHLIRRRALVFLLFSGVMLNADQSFSKWFQSQVKEKGLSATLMEIKEACFVVQSTKTTGKDKKKKKTVKKMETAVVGRGSQLEVMLLEDISTAFGSMPGDAEEGLCVITMKGDGGGRGGLQTPGKSFLAKGMISKNQGACASDDGVKVVRCKDTQAVIKSACDSLGLENQSFTHRSLRKNYASGMDDRARAYAEFMSKHTTGAGQWAEGSDAISKHYITSDTQGLLSMLGDELSPDEHAASDLAAMKKQVFLKKVSA